MHTQSPLSSFLAWLIMIDHAWDIGSCDPNTNLRFNMWGDQIYLLSEDNIVLVCYLKKKRSKEVR